MKFKSIKEEMKSMKTDQLNTKIEELRRELIALRLQAATSPIKDFAARKNTLRRAIACGLTLRNQMEQG